MENSIEYARRWLDRSKDSDDCFDRFVFAYFGLNALYNRFYKYSEKNAIVDLFNDCYGDNRNVKSYSKFRNAVDIILHSEAFEYFKKRDPVKNCRYNDSNETDKKDCTEEKNEIQGAPENRRRAIALLKIIYQVRCNLFHGNKCYLDENDNKTIHNAAEILISFLDAFIESQEPNVIVF